MKEALTPSWRCRSGGVEDEHGGGEVEDAVVEHKRGGEVEDTVVEHKRGGEVEDAADLTEDDAEAGGESASISAAVDGEFQMQIGGGWWSASFRS